jgi:alpha-L-fucosidase 2
MFAPGFPYNESHRHFSHLMAYHPLGLLDFSNGDPDRRIIQNTLKNLEDQGTSLWTGYSFSWQGNLYARALEGEKAEKVLEIFSECFCLKNSFHVNGDQCKAGYSSMTYRPFTLEGNFAFASAIQEMLIQSHTGVVRLFPAIPADWSYAKFSQLRTYGAFLVSAQMRRGEVVEAVITSTAGGMISLHNPFGDAAFDIDHPYELEGDIIKLKTSKGSKIRIIRR